MYIPSTHLKVCGELPSFTHSPLKKEKGTVIFIYLRGISWDSENLGQFACSGDIDRPKARNWIIQFQDHCFPFMK